MSLSYQEFNKKCFDYYVDNNQNSEFATFLIPPRVIVDWLSIDYNNPSVSFVELENDWEYLLKVDHKYEIPKCFGLIALQCFARFRMSRNDFANKNQYVIQLVKLINLKTNFTQKCGTGPKENIQELLWRRASEFLKKYGILIDIPQKEPGPTRNVRYPKSQVQFTIHSFQSVSWFLELMDQDFCSEILPFSKRFKEEYATSEGKIKLAEFSEIMNNTAESLEKYEKFIYQFYNYYRASDWRQRVIAKIENQSFKKITVESELAISVYFDFEKHNIKFYNQNDPSIELITDNIIEILQQEFLIFENSPDRVFDFYPILDFNMNKPYLVLSLSNGRNFEILKNKFNLQFRDYGSDSRIRYAWLTDGFQDLEILNFIFSRTKRFNINPFDVKGIRINFRKREFLYGYNIEITKNKLISANEPLSLYRMVEGSAESHLQLDFENEICIILQSMLRPGVYELRHPKFSSISFRIVQVTLNNRLKIKESSYNPKTSLYENNLIGINGINYPLNPVTENITIAQIRKWAIGRKTPSENKILTALNHYRYGSNK